MIQLQGDAEQAQKTEGQVDKATYAINTKLGTRGTPALAVRSPSGALNYHVRKETPGPPG